jgi:hypothetical protein
MLSYSYRQQAAGPTYSEMAQDNASKLEVHTGNSSPFFTKAFYQSEDASIVLGRRKTKPHAFAVERNSVSLPIPILGERTFAGRPSILTLRALRATGAIPRPGDGNLHPFLFIP